MVRKKKRTDIPASAAMGNGPVPTMPCPSGVPHPNRYIHDVMSHARHEILDLRRQNEILSAKVDTLEIFAVALGMRNGNQGASVDVAWELRNAMNSLQV